MIKHIWTASRSMIHNNGILYIYILKRAAAGGGPGISGKQVSGTGHGGYQGK
jgi:hypothetical protein